jgi:hypothetical protein
MARNEAIHEARAYAGFLSRQGAELLQADTLARIGSRNMTAWKPHPPLLASLIADIRDQKPFSLIRLGDGEGNVLFWGYRRIEYPGLARFAMEQIWRLMFGSAGQVADFHRVHDGMAGAALGADYLGISQLAGYERSIGLLRDCPAEELDLRGQSGAAAVWDWVSAHMKHRIEAGGPVLISAWFHGDLVPAALRDLLNATRKLSLVTCHPALMDRFVATFGVGQGLIYLIPNQYSNVGESQVAVHYPDRFEEIAADLATRDLTGELFLVGAGILGKIYCDLIKRQGGMAIDAGSMMDVWMGMGVRQYQNAAFVEARQLSQAAGDLAG